MLKSLPPSIIIIIITFATGLAGVTVFRKINYGNNNSNNTDKLNDGITLIDRFCSIPAYWLPLLEGLQNFGQQILPDYPFSLMSLYKKTLMPFVIVYVTHPNWAFVVFFILYYLFVRPKSPIPNRPFLRFNVIQAILLFLINSLLGATFRALPIEFRMSLYGLMLCNTLFWFVLLTITYSVIKSVQGKYAKIPVISQAVKIQIDNRN
uniref:Tic20 family protein Ycf60 n=1 Tax=Helminthora furcellata TaxID=1884666 RepID=A0A1G4NZ59_9FLOR|nr:Hypothetical protein ycf60 [Helminthora furcellata]SCW21044.1 Hypothetical protein ycf60 [Helminthora furcellata]SCW23904.1 Hypothetical protein ycf60 [Helminthora furcellata]